MQYDATRSRWWGCINGSSTLWPGDLFIEEKLVMSIFWQLWCVLGVGIGWRLKEALYWLSRECSDARWSRIVFCCRGLEKFRMRIEGRAGDPDLCVVL